MRRWRCLTLQGTPDLAGAMNSHASQSRSSGCVGRWPRVPKSFGVGTSPRPKWCCQMRLTMTRAVSGLLVLAIQSAKVARGLSGVGVVPADLAVRFALALEATVLGP